MPGYGGGTNVMQFRSNHAMPRSCATRFTAVGERRVSMGPPISVIDTGTASEPSASIRATAASTGTAGWHTAMTWRSGPRSQIMSRR